MRGAVFLDKDGTLVEDVPYNADPARLRLTAGAAGALARLRACGYPLIVITNQPGVARGRLHEAEVRRLRAHLLADAGLGLADLYYCPHDPAGSVPAYAVPCGCRKPAPGLILQACAEHGLDPRRSWCIGDILDDVEAGRRAGCRTVLLDNGHETEWRRSPLRQPDHTVTDLVQAAALIAGQAERRA
ncbi:MAG: D-glycero-alpha-D-manno-heptose-1,7-bisphosphate 7-phosphatase [Candidatus Methylomirabilales bacterium]